MHNMLMCVSLCFLCVVCLCAGFLTQMWEFVALCFFWVACLCAGFLTQMWEFVVVFFLGSVFVCRVPKVFECLGEMICHLQDHECQKHTQINCGSCWNSGKFHTLVVYYYISIVSQNGNTLIPELWNEGCTRIAQCELKLNRTHMHTQTCIYTCTWCSH